MKALFPVVCVCAYLVLAGCSDESRDFNGQWMNSDKSTLDLKNDSVAVMGQTGVEGDVEGTYWSVGDTVWVKSPLVAESDVDMYNLFTFFYSGDSLYLERITLYRGDDYQSLEGDEFSRRLGKTESELAFVRGNGGAR